MTGTRAARAPEMRQERMHCARETRSTRPAAGSLLAPKRAQLGDASERGAAVMRCTLGTGVRVGTAVAPSQRSAAVAHAQRDWSARAAHAIQGACARVRLRAGEAHGRLRLRPGTELRRDWVMQVSEVPQSHATRVHANGTGALRHVKRGTRVARVAAPTLDYQCTRRARSSHRDRVARAGTAT